MMPGFEDLKVYRKAYELAMEIFNISKSFPVEERYSLSDQIRRSLTSVCSNIAEAYRKRKYPKHFSSKSSEADSEASETMVWLNFARDCEYISNDIFDSLNKRYMEVGKMLGSMVNNPEKFVPN